jgi:hypothetical protein
MSDLQFDEKIDEITRQTLTGFELRSGLPVGHIIESRMRFEDLLNDETRQEKQAPTDNYY